MRSSVNNTESRTFFGHPYPLGSLFFTEGNGANLLI